MEKQVWRMLFRMVEGHDLDGSLLELVESIPWDVLAATPEGDQQWFALSRTSSQIATSSKQITSSPALTLMQTVSSTQTSPPSPIHQSLTEEGAQTNMDLRPDFEAQADGENAMDTRPDGGDGGFSRRGKQNLDGEEANDVEEQRSNDDDELVPGPDGIKRTSTSRPKNALKRKRRLGTKNDKNHMPSSALKHLLDAGESYNMPVDVEAVDMLMRNFPITEEHQVRLC
jgi:hypothetical protein